MFLQLNIVLWRFQQENKETRSYFQPYIHSSHRYNQNKSYLITHSFAAQSCYFFSTHFFMSFCKYSLNLKCLTAFKSIESLAHTVTRHTIIKGSAQGRIF